MHFALRRSIRALLCAIFLILLPLAASAEENADSAMTRGQDSVVGVPQENETHIGFQRLPLPAEKIEQSNRERPSAAGSSQLGWGIIDLAREKVDTASCGILSSIAAPDIPVCCEIGLNLCIAICEARGGLKGFICDVNSCQSFCECNPPVF